jgi:hypothetical protein
MRKNPAGNWSMARVETLCGQVSLFCKPPRSGGSHFKVWSPHLDGILTIPASRPIKAVYIKKLVRMADAHRRITAQETGND